MIFRLIFRPGSSTRAPLPKNTVHVYPFLFIGFPGVAYTQDGYPGVAILKHKIHTFGVNIRAQD